MQIVLLCFGPGWPLLSWVPAWYLVVFLVKAYYKNTKHRTPEISPGLRALTSGLERGPGHNGHFHRGQVSWPWSCSERKEAPKWRTNRAVFPGAGQRQPLLGTAYLQRFLKPLSHNFPTKDTALSLSGLVPLCPMG